MDALLTSLVKSGAPWGLLCAALSLAVVALWRRVTELSNKLYEVSMAQLKRDLEFHHTLEAARLEMAELRRIHEPRRANP